MSDNKATVSSQGTEIKYPDIIIGIVSPVGTDIKTVVEELRSRFKKIGYESHHIKITKAFPDLAAEFSYQGLDESSKFKRINSYIKFGNRLRENINLDILSRVAISMITDERDKVRTQGYGRRSTDKKGVVYIIDQLKTEAEIKLLRQIYDKSFFQVSVYSARDIRVDNLSREMAHDDRKADRINYREKAEHVVSKDENEPDKFGQKVGKIFQYADVVLNIDRTDEQNKLSNQIKRFVELLFGYNGYSPTRLEYGMYLAHSAALRSLDLSRQVGAAIFRPTGEIATLGANEVPKANGGSYWCDEGFDAREYTLSRDSNDARKEEILQEIIEILRGADPKLTDKELKSLADSQFMDALEYGRIVHAEMSALSDAARLGISVAGGTLYCTTFPCHMCSKHIVASGLTKVVFLEPYPKSLTSDLHSDSVKIEGMSRGSYDRFPSVNFIPFFGITPTRYRELFSRQKRKADRAFSRYRDGFPRPIFSFLVPEYLTIESEINSLLVDEIVASKEKDWNVELDGVPETVLEGERDVGTEQSEAGLGA
ncbi:dCMP deaminase [Ochrobactrum sp. C6C9]|uniref:anti-phage dCTP deaminase n=1 Tax=Ochrobactrum sp. C6C9 TaxID=2736662 RepID=UPI0035304218|nr:dCMP deaminase [Ochrobactrum sp. C6C9]